MAEDNCCCRRFVIAHNKLRSRRRCDLNWSSPIMIILLSLSSCCFRLVFRLALPRRHRAPGAPPGPLLRGHFSPHQCFLFPAQNGSKSTPGPKIGPKLTGIVGSQHFSSVLLARPLRRCRCLRTLERRSITALLESSASKYLSQQPLWCFGS